MMLNKARILLTRPAAANAQLLPRLEALGAQVLSMPLLRLQALPALASLPDAADLAVFISPSAVDLAAPHVREFLADNHACELAVVGAGSAEALRRYTRKAIWQPEHGADAAALIALLQKRDWSQKRVLLLRGEGGNPALADFFRAKNAKLWAKPIYQRQMVAPDVAALRAFCPNVVFVAQRDAVDALFCPPENAALKSALFLVPHEKIAAHLGAFGAQYIAIAQGTDASLQALISEIKKVIA